jgi:hypothetical protein
MDQITADIRTTDQVAPAIEAPGLAKPSFVEALVDPVNTFRDPAAVAEHPGFTTDEKRTILLSWARDELVIEQVANKAAPELRPRSRIDAVIEALAQFDPSAAGEYRSAAASIRAPHQRHPSRRKRME